jgi:hypothetical protein
MKTATLTLKGGMIDSTRIPKGVKVIVKYYDIDENDYQPGQLKKDDMGTYTTFIFGGEK